jgi:tRNA/tmRNA/rRNA uracil-C5-methylase (TrmA/RlmC/RlmD family)
MRKSREIKIKREDAEKYFKRRIKEEEDRLNDYRSRLSLGEDMTIAIRGSERKIEDLKDELKKVLNRFEEEDLVIERNPEVFSVAIIIAKGES